jgi:hypothetical protein
MEMRANFKASFSLDLHQRLNSFTKSQKDTRRTHFIAKATRACSSSEMKRIAPARGLWIFWTENEELLIHLEAIVGCHRRAARFSQPQTRTKRGGAPILRPLIASIFPKTLEGQIPVHSLTQTDSRAGLQPVQLCPGVNGQRIQG